MQQNEIDKAKGIVCKPMPREWYDRHAVNKIEDEDRRELYRRVVTDRKPYFMCYIYPELKREYKTFVKNADKNARRIFGISLGDLLSVNNPTDDQAEFIKYYNIGLPVGTSDCVMNRNCRAFEAAFDGWVGKASSCTDFDYSIMKSGAEYSNYQKEEVRKLMDEYNETASFFAVKGDFKRTGDDDYDGMTELNGYFLRRCREICPNEEALTDIILDLCYKRNKTKRFAWTMCAEQIVKNLVRNNGGLLFFPMEDEYGDFTFRGGKFSVHAKLFEEEEE
jgi:hypothetical protein